MIDPIEIGDAWLDRAAITGLLRHHGNLYVFLRGSKTVTMTDNFSDEEIGELIKGPRTPRE